MKDNCARRNEEAHPSVVTYNALLNACKFSHGDEFEMEFAFEVTCETLDKVRSSDYLALDDITYGTSLGVISKLVPNRDTRNELVELIFKQCCVDGQLGPLCSRSSKMLQACRDTRNCLAMPRRRTYRPSGPVMSLVDSTDIGERFCKYSIY
jgi:hypothetical protein